MPENTHKTIVTHNSKFHADDIFACAVLDIVFSMQGISYTLTRTRDEAIITSADYVFDIGGIYDPAINRFDHHQKGGAGTRENGIPYASVGLVWKTYGMQITGNVEVARRLDMKLFAPIDADDNGHQLVDIRGDVAPYRVQESYYAYRATWKEDPANYDIVFPKLVAQAKELILREIKVISDNLEADTYVEKAYMESSDKRLIVLEGNYPYEYLLSTKSEPLFVVAPRPDGNWKVATVTVAPFIFTNRKDLPKSWGGLRDEALAEVTGISDAIFCHNGLFLAVTKTKESALQLATLALKS